MLCLCRLRFRESGTYMYYHFAKNVILNSCSIKKKIRPKSAIFFFLEVLRKDKHSKKTAFPLLAALSRKRYLFLTAIVQ